MYYYGARYYDPQLGRFASPDTTIPLQQGSQAWDRYAYVNNNPVRYKDPSGHDVCDEEGNCYNRQGWYRAPNAARLSTIDTWKMMIFGKFHVSMSDEGDKKWDYDNLRLMYNSLQNVDKALNGRFASLVGSATFKWMEYTGPEVYSGFQYGNKINFNTKGNAEIRQMNIYHEIGHLLDHAPGLEHVFSNAVGSPSWVTSGYVSGDALNSSSVSDPNYGLAEAIQASAGDKYEQWADAFANYVAGNINLSKTDSPGEDMYNFVYDVLAPRIDLPKLIKLP